MTDSDQEPDLFTQALRLDLPSTADEARVRAKLVSAGVLAGASVVVPGAAAAATTGGGFAAKLAALPLALKIGASVVAVSAAALPVVTSVASSSDTHPAPRSAEMARVAPAPAGAATTAESAAAPHEEPATGAPAPEAPASPVTQAPARARENAPASAVASPAAVAVLPAVGAFPAAEAAPVDEGTLRAETALMERALAAIKQGDLAAARRELALHAAKFPNGHLKPERERALERTLGKETER
jgi:hypothetical protein